MKCRVTMCRCRQCRRRHHHHLWTQLWMVEAVMPNRLICGLACTCVCGSDNGHTPVASLTSVPAPGILCCGGGGWGSGAGGLWSGVPDLHIHIVPPQTTLVSPEEGREGGDDTQQRIGQPSGAYGLFWRATTFCCALTMLMCARSLHHHSIHCRPALYGTIWFSFVAV